MEVNCRFSISSYIDEEKHQNLGKIKNAEINKLVYKSQRYLQDHLDHKDLREVFKNKSVSMLFLDKISKLIGKHHPDSIEARKFMGGPTSYPSLELIRHFSQLLNNPLLSKETVENLEKWISLEQACLRISLIFDAWGAVNEESVIRSTTKGNFPELPSTHKITPPNEELEIFSSAIADEMRSMHPGDTFKMPAGSLNHVTRLKFIKKDNATFDIIHFNTGFGVIEIKGKDCTACKYKSVSSEKLENASFWKLLAEAKMQADMTVLNDLLKNLNPRVPPVDIIKWLKKPLQESGSCSFHSAEAEFKYSFITNFISIEKGWDAYKQCTSLMALNATQNEANELEPSIKKMLFAKEKIRRRYLDWMTIQDNRGEFEIIKNAYIEAITTMGRYTKKNNETLVEYLPPLMSLSILDKRLNDGLDSISYEQLIHIRNTYGPDVTFNGFNPIGYKQLKWIESTREVMQDVIEFTGWKGQLILGIKELSQILLSSKWNNEIQTKLNYAILDKKSLNPLLTEYLLREDLDIQDLILEALVKEDFLYDGVIVYNHIKKCLYSDPRKVLELIKKPMDEEIKKEIMSRACKKLLEEGHSEIALEIALLLEISKRNQALVDITVIHIINGQIDKAMACVKLNHPICYQDIIEKLCKNGMPTLALKFTSLIPDAVERTISFRKISYELIKSGKAKMAMNTLQLMPYSDLGETISHIIFNLCKENLLNDAILFISHIPRFFYSDESHMIVQDAFHHIITLLERDSRHHDVLRLISRLPEGPLKVCCQ